MRTRSFAVVASLVVVGCASVVACSAFSGSDAVGTPSPDASAADATTVAADASGTVSIDASIDPVDSAPGCGPFANGHCAMLDGGAFCADFDNPQCPLLGFTSVVTGNDKLEISTTESSSAPASMHITQTIRTPQTGTWGPTVDIPIPMGTSKVEVAFDYRVPFLPAAVAAPGGDAPRIGLIHLDATKTGGPTVDFYLESNKSYFQFGPPMLDYSSDGPAAKLNIWHSIAMTFDLGASKITATMDGPKLADGQTLRTPLKGGQTLTLTVGYEPYVLEAGETFVDNVVVKFNP